MNFNDLKKIFLLKGFCKINDITCKFSSDGGLPLFWQFAILTPHYGKMAPLVLFDHVLCATVLHPGF